MLVFIFCFGIWVNMSVEQLYNIIKGNVWNVKRYQNGILVKASNRPIDVEECNQFSLAIQELLGITLPVREPFR